MTEDLFQTIQTNYQRVLEDIENSAISVGRKADSVKLVVVTKGHSIEIAQTVTAVGGTSLGENYVDDAVPKIEALEGKNIEWHMIGHVQSRKARLVSEHFAWVHSVDRLKLARRLNNFSGDKGRMIPVLLECNVSGEASKFGWSTWDEEHWPNFASEIAALIELPNLDVRGLMTMPPYDPDPEKSRPYFIKLRRLRDYLSDQFPKENLSELSMGMSNDYQVAIQEGATIIRVGTAIVGQRSF
ncbi:YggS family pyridoxal phosphate-dependent enzyme [Chloroflexota bacterium]